MLQSPRFQRPAFTGVPNLRDGSKRLWERIGRIDLRTTEVLATAICSKMIPSRRNTFKPLDARFLDKSSFGSPAKTSPFRSNATFPLEMEGAGTSNSPKEVSAHEPGRSFPEIIDGPEPTVFSYVPSPVLTYLVKPCFFSLSSETELDMAPSDHIPPMAVRAGIRRTLCPVTG